MENKSNRWQPITPDETRGGEPLAVRQRGPRLRYYILMGLITALVYYLKTLGFTFPVIEMIGFEVEIPLFFVVAAWSSIAASETDVNSPLNQTLFDKIRGNLDYLYGQLVNDEPSAVSFINYYYDNGTQGGTTNYTLDSTKDWRDRFIGAAIAAAQNGITTAQWVPGGANDQEIYTQNTTAAAFGFEACGFEMMYSGTGSADAGEPYIKTASGGFYLYVDSTTGALMMRVVGAVNYAYNVMVINGADVGAV